MLTIDSTKWLQWGIKLFLIYVSLISILSGGSNLARQLPSPMFAAATYAPNDSPVLLNQVVYNVSKPFVMQMGETKEVHMFLYFNKNVLSATKMANLFRVNFKTVTLSPQFNIIALGNASKQVTVFRKHLEESDYIQELRLRMRASYIGHAILKPESISFNEPVTNVSMLIAIQDSNSNNYTLPITIDHDIGFMNVLFIISVTFLVLLSYVNIGAQLDMDNVEEIIKKPKTVILSFLITVIVMPSVSWIVGQLFLGNQLFYRVGSFIFACGPAASASTLWTVMLDSNKELSVGLQVASTIGALFTMPALLYFMDLALGSEGNQHQIQIPYGRLSETLFALLVALLIGWKIVNLNKSAKKFSDKVFRPLTFFVLLFIIVFSSIIYWYIYQMFDWTITIASVLITILTYLISAGFGYLINFDLSDAIAISISSTYKNSGIAFAVLLAFGSPDTYIYFVPCLTQVCTTSLMLYLIYSCLSLVKYIKRRGQPDPIQAVEEGTNESNRDNGKFASPTTHEGSQDEKEFANNNEEKAEFMAMITTDEIAKEPRPSVGDVAEQTVKKSDSSSEQTT